MTVEEQQRRDSRRNSTSSAVDMDSDSKEKVRAECVEDVGHEGGYIPPIEIQARFETLRHLSGDEMEKLNKRVRKIIDWRMMPCVSVMFLMNYLDRINVSNARLAGLQKDLGMSDTVWNTGISTFYVGYLLGQLPGNMLLTRTNPRYFLPAVMFMWSAGTICMPAMTNGAGFAVCRFFIGLTEAPFFPALTLMTSSWYTKEESPLRMAIWHAGNTVSNIVSGFLAAGILEHMDNTAGMHSWQWFFLIEGIASILVAFVAFFVLPEWPSNTRFLTEQEREMAQYRILVSNGGREEEDGALWDGVKQAVRDPFTWFFCLMHFSLVTAQSFKDFLPSIMKTFNFDTTTTYLVQAPPYAIAYASACLIAYSCGRFQESTLHVIVPIIFSAAGCGVLIGTLNVGARYFGLVLLISGTYSGLNLQLSWETTVVPAPRAKKAALIAIANCISQVSQLEIEPSISRERKSVFFEYSLVAGLLASHPLGSSAVATRHNWDGQKPLEKTSITDGNPFNTEVNEFVNDVMERWKIPGMSVAVIDGESVYTQGYGYATLPDTKATPETLYFAGSTSKAFAAGTLAHMIDSKNYTSLASGWTTPISAIIRDDFVMQGSWATENLNLEDAASHRTGMPRHDLSWAKTRFEDSNSKVSTADVVRSLRHLKPSAAPRTTWQYCNLMYVVLGHVIETLTGKWLGEAIRERIWEPLGMTATFGDTKDALAVENHLAAGYYWDFEKEDYITLRVDSTRESGGAGLVISTVEDYSKWVKCLLYETQPFSKEAHKDIRKTRMLTDTQEEAGDGDLTYGLAWMKKTYHGEVVYKHGGTELAYSTQVYWIPRLKFGVVTMANTGQANSAEDEVVWRLIEDKLDIPDSERYDIASSLEETMNETKRALRDLGKTFYPDKPKSPLPSSLNNSQITGKYFDAGYGYLNIFEAQVDGETMLVANRTEMLTPYELRFGHVSGNYWLANIYIADLNSKAGAWAGEFKVGVDGEAEGLEIQLTSPGEAIDEGKVWFKRTA